MALRTISSSSTSRMRPGWVESRINLAIIRAAVFSERMHTTFRAKKEILKKSFPHLRLAAGSHITELPTLMKKKSGRRLAGSGKKMRAKQQASNEPLPSWAWKEALADFTPGL